MSDFFLNYLIFYKEVEHVDGQLPLRAILDGKLQDFCLDFGLLGLGRLVRLLLCLTLLWGGLGRDERETASLPSVFQPAPRWVCSVWSAGRWQDNTNWSGTRLLDLSIYKRYHWFVPMLCSHRHWRWIGDWTVALRSCWRVGISWRILALTRMVSFMGSLSVSRKILDTR